MKRLTKISLGATGVWILGIASVIVLRIGDACTMTLNEWGDFLAGAFAPLALGWLVVGYFQHGEELRLNTKTLEAQQEELRRQVEETANLARNSERQAKAAEELAQITASKY